MLIWKILLFASWGIIFYNYAGYAIIALIFNKLFPYRDHLTIADEAIPEEPPVSFIVAAYNERHFIETKIKNSLAQDYPASKIEFIFVTDGSTDETYDIIHAHPSIHLLHRPERLGKTDALNRAVAVASHEVIIVSDANTILNKDAVRLIAAHYALPHVGGVAGEKKVVPVLPVEGQVGYRLAAGGGMTGGIVRDAAHDDGPGEGEGLYWKYESALKRIDSEFYSVVGAAGELFSFRKSLYEPIPATVILDDFIISMRIAEKGYRVLYEPGAYAMETPSFSMEEERKRKVRIAAGGFQSVVMLSELLSFWKYPRLSFLYISHRVLRWFASPFCLVLALVAGVILCLGDLHPFYQWLMAAQLAFFGLGLLYPFLPGRGPLRIFRQFAKLSRYFIFMNFSVILGFWRWLRNKQPAAWEKSRRAN